MHAMRVKTPLLPTWGVGLVCGAALTLALVLALGVPGLTGPSEQRQTGVPAVAAVADQLAGTRDLRAPEVVPQGAVPDPAGGLRGGRGAVDTPQMYFPANAGSTQGGENDLPRLDELSYYRIGGAGTTLTVPTSQPNGSGGLK